MNQPILLYDGTCGLCNKAVAFVFKNERNNILHFASLQSEFAKNLIQEQSAQLLGIDSIILTENDKIYIKSRALVQLAKFLKSPFNLLKLLKYVPAFMADWGYDLIARNRHLFFKQKDSCIFPNAQLKSRFLD